MAHITKKAYKVVGAMLKEANKLKADIKVELASAYSNYSDMKRYSESCDFPIAECYNPYHAFDKVNSLVSFQKDLRAKAIALRAWLDKFEWKEIVTDKGYKFIGAEVTDKQQKFVQNLYKEYAGLLNKYYSK